MGLRPEARIEQAPGNARPWWEGLGLPLTVLRAPGLPARCGQSGGREDTWPGMTFAPAGQAAAPSPVAPRSPQPPQSLISPPSEQLVLPGKLPNESTMPGLWRRNGPERDFLPARPTRHGGTCGAAERSAPLPTHPGTLEIWRQTDLVPLPIPALPLAICALTQVTTSQCSFSSPVQMGLIPYLVLRGRAD